MSSSSKLAGRAITPHLALIAVQIMFGTWPIIGKVALRSLSSTSLVGLRIFGAAIVFSLLQRKLGELRQLPKRVIAWLVLSSVLGVVVNQLVFVKGLSLTTAINATLLTTTIPVVTLVVSIALGYDRPSIRHVLGIALAAAGVIYLVDPLASQFRRTNNPRQRSHHYQCLLLRRVHCRLQRSLQAIWRPERNHVDFSDRRSRNVTNCRLHLER